MGIADDSTTQHPSVRAGDRHRSGEHDPIWEILKSQREMRGEINDIKETLAKGSHAIGSVDDLMNENRDKEKRITVLETKMGILSWVASVSGGISIAAIIGAVFALIFKAHP